jgi:hypothetical protein
VIDPSRSFPFHPSGEAPGAAVNLAATPQSQGHFPSPVSFLTMPPGGLRDVHNGTRIGADETAMLTTQRRDRRVRRQAGLLVESLDDRILLSWGAQGATAEALVHSQPANHAQRFDHVSPREVTGVQSPAALPANVSAPLRSLYREYEDQVRDNGSTPSLSSDGSPSIRGLEIAVRIKVAFPPALDAYLPKLRADGLQIIRTVPAYGLAEGMLPVAKLPAVAQLAAHVWPLSLPIKQ